MGTLILAVAAFVGTHFALSHPLRAPLVARLGARGFLLLYSLVAFATLGWAAHVYMAMPDQPPLWPVGDGLWAAASVLMLAASILLIGSLIGNPALPDPVAKPRAVPQPRGVFAITRHPMMWSFAIWALVHIAVMPMPAQIVLAAGIGVLALVGAALQDRKKASLEPDFWPQWAARTSYFSFTAIIARRLPLSAARLRPHDWAGGIALWLAATWAHMPLAGWPAGIWRWIG
ncbi:NnrU family protein [Sphingomonas baiyangensis]|uniref:MFS transporter n=1 Tax=Sphingomonas baiyangensis TaxID=2572576 RepID=A0A4U1L575_9SPHN|nr:NnrU family protein [Sphingomonas baiyangensis]TKD51952.1 MFS transporter [Sphingomonas baiyangensis]